ncbi:TrkA N-terminal domain protein [Gleimia coleocanis DSM 15436]|uniref:Trk system potassium uptake protein TrkA n=1 Tax=Gleimia coleocanis DSM 15436 TaxID=525245 RepID=C0W1S5_9ACTO|nr:TrkA family potassium uptake protein [Gleimia coleocanis]EEH63441.1 TrkA N-terminal domain protein [Gleimia coleocanis DSM 15436]
MQIVIAGAGSVGRSIARELLSKGHEVTLIDRHPDQMRVASVAQADWVLADACSPDSLREAGVGTCDVMVAATGDDKANLVISLLAKTEYGVPRVVARVNNPKNEWMFDEAWGVDVRVSTPRVMTALVEEAVSVGVLVPLFEFHEAGAALYSYTIGADSAALDLKIGKLGLPGDAKILSILRDDAPLDSIQDVAIEAGDQLVLMLSSKEASLRADVELALGPKRSEKNPA